MSKTQKIIFLAALLMLALLFAAGRYLEPHKATLISNITEKNLNQLVKIEGSVISIREYSNNTFQVLKFQDKTGIIEATAGSKSGLRDKINFSLNYSIIGKVTEYNKTLQISIDELRVLS